MSGSIKRQESKEFQIKLTHQKGDNPDAYMKRAATALKEAIKEVFDGKSKLGNIPEPWTRHGLRFDTQNSALKSHDCTLAIEASKDKKGTKLKCKLHNFIPELLFEVMDEAISFPTRTLYKGKDIKPKIKLEQDIHFDNIKFCCSGSVILLVVEKDFKNVDDFAAYFGRLLDLAPRKTRLVVVSDWEETVYEDIALKSDDLDTDFTLVTRFGNKRGCFLESELSYKIKKDYGKDWNYRALQLANRLYLALQKDKTFMKVPPIFFVDTPASSTDIKLL